MVLGSLAIPQIWNHQKFVEGKPGHPRRSLIDALQQPGLAHTFGGWLHGDLAEMGEVKYLPR